MPLEVLHGALVRLGRFSRLEGAEIAALSGFRVQLSRVQPIFA
jgi:hypothetical protein